MNGLFLYLIQFSKHDILFEIQYIDRVKSKKLELFKIWLVCKLGGSSSWQCLRFGLSYTRSISFGQSVGRWIGECFSRRICQTFVVSFRTRFGDRTTSWISAWIGLRVTWTTTKLTINRYLIWLVFSYDRRPQLRLLEISLLRYCPVGLKERLRPQRIGSSCRREEQTSLFLLVLVTIDCLKEQTPNETN